ncbi:MAG TPA: hypothetical protein VGH34_05735 [Vicinamibacterales bacterium]
MPRDLEQVFDVVETRLQRQVTSDITDPDRFDRIDDDVTVIHRVATTHLDVRAGPDANAASDSPAPDSFPQAFGKHHTGAAKRKGGEPFDSPP